MERPIIDSDQSVETDDRGAVTKDRGAETEDRYAETEDRGAEIEDRYAETEDRYAETEDRGAEIEDRYAEIEDRGAEIEDRGNSFMRPHFCPQRRSIPKCIIHTYIYILCTIHTYLHCIYTCTHTHTHTQHKFHRLVNEPEPCDCPSIHPACRTYTPNPPQSPGDFSSDLHHHTPVDCRPVQPLRITVFGRRI